MDRIKLLLALIEEKTSTAALVLVCVVTLLQITARYMPTIPVPTWSEEIVRYFFMWMVFFGVSYNIRNDEHIKADFLANKLFVGKSRIIIHTLRNVITLLFCIIIVIEGSKLCFLEFKTQRRLISLAIPIFIVSLVIPLTFAFSAFHIIFDLFHSKKGGKD